MRLYGAVALAFFVTLGAGWVWGRSGRSELETGLRDTRQADRATRLDPALAALRDAQRLTLALDQSAHNKAAEALKALN